jgi:GT2 family glycosyltransferase
MEEVAAASAVDISVSVVSHLQIGLVAQLLADLDAHCKDSRLELILTLNLDESLPFDLSEFSYPIKLVRNTAVKGFGANHNQAFALASGRYFCVMNPDIRLSSNPFRTLLVFFGNSSIGVAAPLVLNEGGEIEDSARRFPTPLKILCKAIGKCKDNDYVIGDKPFHPDWVGGMFMLFPRTVFEQLVGFDERYFLYYEDVDLCGRLRLLGYEALVNPQAKVTHHAQRTSRRSVTYLRWHFTSMMRFFSSPVFWRLQRLVRP